MKKYILCFVIIILLLSPAASAMDRFDIVTTQQLKQMLDDRRLNKAMVTLVDYRNENFLKTEKPLPLIKTGCPTIKCFLDDLSDPAVRNKIPKKGLVVLVCETGNRDAVAMRYLHKYGYNNVVGLRTGMRGWIKLGYPVEFSK